MGLGALMFAALAAVAAVTAPPGSTPAASAPAASASPAGNALNVGMPTPYPVQTLAPLTGTTSLPYPAYGTPVPGVNAGTPAPDVSASLGLQQSEMVGFARSPALTIARGDVGVAAAAVRLEQAGLLPLLSGAASYGIDHAQPGGFSATSGTTSGTGVTTLGPSTSHNADFSVSLSQLIWDGGRIAAAVRAARNNETASADTYRRELQTVAYNVASAYYTYLAAERLTQVDLEIVRENEVQEDLVRAQVRAGTAAQSQIATAELPVAQARLAVVRAQGAELAAEAAFVNAMGLDANVRVQPIDDAPPIFSGGPVSSLPVPSYDAALKRAVALRPDYDASVQGVNQARNNLRSAELGLFPTLAGSAGAADDSTNGYAGNFRNSQTLGVALSIPIYDQGVTAANTATDRAQLAIALANLQTTALGLELSIKQALTSLVSAQAALVQTQQEYATAVVNLQATQAQYKAGVTTLPLLLDAQVGLSQALTDQVTAVYTLRQAEQTYLYQVGANYDASSKTNLVRVQRSPATNARAHAPAGVPASARANAATPAAAVPANARASAGDPTQTSLQTNVQRRSAMALLWSPVGPGGTDLRP
jgi:outer membrane protein TolC